MIVLGLRPNGHCRHFFEPQKRESTQSRIAFSVGAAAHVLRNGGMQVVSKHGANFKNGSGNSSIDDHAEDLVLKDLLLGDRTSILAVVGPTQPDHGSGLDLNTLHPCFKCRPLLLNSKHVTPQTLIVCATPTFTDVEWGTIDDFTNYHAQRPNNIRHAKFTATPSVFQPVPAPSERGYDLCNSALDIDTADWDTGFVLPLAGWLREQLP